MNTILVINTKGGVGKTTIATNLASYFAVNNIPTTIMDYDPQGSSLHWLGKRSLLGTTIHGANAAQPIDGGLRSIRMHVPADTQRLIVDAPAGTSRLLLQEMLGKVNSIVTPAFAMQALTIILVEQIVRPFGIAHFGAGSYDV